MRRALFFLLLLLPTLAIAPLPQNPQPASQVSTQNQRMESRMDRDEDIFSYAKEQDMLFQRVFQKNLPPLSRKELIVWSFRTAETTPFL